MSADRSRFRPAPGAFVTLIVLILAVVLIWTARQKDQDPVPQTISLYCFSAMREVMSEGILPAFRETWRERTGERIEFACTFAGSGTITDRIIRQLPVEIAILSSELDAQRLVQRGLLLGSTWRQQPHGGVIARSPIILLMRSDAIGTIHGLFDLGSEGIAITHADPLTAGVGECAIVAVYGVWWRSSGSEGKAAEELARLWDNVVVQAPSAREARARFERGDGDALLTYEAEAFRAVAAMAPPPAVVIPDPTLLGEHVALVIGRNVAEEQRELVDAFVAFLWTDAAQDLLVAHGFRSVDETRNEADPRLAPLAGTFTLGDLGGARDVKNRILDGLWRDEIRPAVEARGAEGQ